MSAGAQQGITVTETPIKYEVSGGKIKMILNETGLSIPNYSIDFESVEAIKKFVDFVYRTGLNDGFQIALNKVKEPIAHEQNS